MFSMYMYIYNLIPFDITIQLNFEIICNVFLINISSTSQIILDSFILLVFLIPSKNNITITLAI